MIKAVLAGVLALSTLIAGCAEETPDEQTARPSPTPIPEGILVEEVPENADAIISSLRYVLRDPACLDEDYRVKENFLADGECGRLIYDPEADALASPRQLYAMDIETGGVTQLTNTDCLFISGQAIDAHTLMTCAVCEETAAAGRVNEAEHANLYLLDLATEEMDCLTCGMGLQAIIAPDYSHATEKIVFSAREGDASHPNHLFTIDAERNLTPITGDSDYMDFDCSWSEDGTRIVFSRLPAPWFSKPTQVWLMDADGSNLERITNGGDNPNDEGSHGPYPIGTDADPDLSPDNTKIVFERLKTGKKNEPMGVWELIVIDVATKEETVLDSSYSNMVPEWKSGGILFLRQVGSADVMERKQSLYLYRDGEFTELETYPYNVFPIGAYGGHWIDFG